VHRKEGTYAILTTQLVERPTPSFGPAISTRMPSFDLVMTEWRCYRTVGGSLRTIANVCLSRCQTTRALNPFPRAAQISTNDRRAKTVSPYHHPFQHIINEGGILEGAAPKGQWFVLLLRSLLVFRATHPGFAHQRGSCVTICMSR